MSPVDAATRDALIDLIRGTTAPAPSAVFMGRDDNLRVTSYNALASVRVEVRWRVLGVDGAVQASGDQHLANTDRTAKQTVFITPEGWLLGGEVFVSGAAPLSGQTYVLVELVRGSTGAIVPLQVIAAGYVTAKLPLTFPGALNAAAIEGAGALRSVTGTTPGAGAELSETVPTGARWELLAFEADLTTNATVANRVPQLTLDDGATVYGRYSVNTNEDASKTWRNSFAAGVPLNADSTRFIISAPLPIGLRVGAGHRIRTVTNSIQAGDQWSAPQMLVREWIEGA